MVEELTLDFLVGDIADDKYFRKANDSDATQFFFLYPQLGAHCTSLSSSYSISLTPYTFTHICSSVFNSVGHLVDNV